MRTATSIFIVSAPGASGEREGGRESGETARLMRGDESITHQTKSGRWIYHAERELTTKEVRSVMPMCCTFSFPCDKHGFLTLLCFTCLHCTFGRGVNSKWIAELDKRKKAKAQARANGGGGDGPESSGESGGE